MGTHVSTGRRRGGTGVEDIDNADLTQALLQVRARRRSHTVTARRQTDRLTGRTYVNAAARATPTTTGPNVTNAPAALTSDAASAANDTTDASNAARNDRARRRASRRR